MIFNGISIPKTNYSTNIESLLDWLLCVIEEESNIIKIGDITITTEEYEND